MTPAEQESLKRVEIDGWLMEQRNRQIEEEEEEVLELTRSTAVAGKRPMSASFQEWQDAIDMDDDEEEDEEIMEHERKYKKDFARNLRCDEEPFFMEAPDLAGYLGVFGLSEFQQISLCRTYANYLTQRTRAKKVGDIPYPDAPRGLTAGVSSTKTKVKSVKVSK